MGSTGPELHLSLSLWHDRPCAQRSRSMCSPSTTLRSGSKELGCTSSERSSTAMRSVANLRMNSPVPFARTRSSPSLPSRTMLASSSASPWGRQKPIREPSGVRRKPTNEDAWREPSVAQKSCRRDGGVTRTGGRCCCWSVARRWLPSRGLVGRVQSCLVVRRQLQRAGRLVLRVDAPDLWRVRRQRAEHLRLALHRAGGRRRWRATTQRPSIRPGVARFSPPPARGRQRHHRANAVMPPSTIQLAPVT